MWKELGALTHQTFFCSFNKYSCSKRFPNGTCVDLLDGRAFLKIVFTLSLPNNVQISSIGHFLMFT